MSLNKTLLALALGLVLAASGCELKVGQEPTARPVSDDVKTKPSEIESTDISFTTTRLYDSKYAIVCYQYYSHNISCVKL